MQSVKQLSIDDYTYNVLRNLPTIEVSLKALIKNVSKAQNQIKLLHEKDDGFITIAVKKQDKWMQYHYSKDELKENIGKILSIEGINVYLSANSFYKPFRRIENIRKLNSLYIDLDYYSLENFKNLTTDQIIWQLERDYFKNKVPEANFIVLTGRGIAIYWLIEPVPYKALPLWNAVQKHFLKELKEIGADEKSIDSSRVMRLAGSINQKSGKNADILVYSEDRYILSEIQEEYLPVLTPYVKNPYYKSKGRNSKIVNFFTLYSLHYARLRDIVALQKIREGYCRNEEGSLAKSGQREFMCFLYRYWSCCYEANKEKALENTLDFNKGFKVPLDYKEVERATKSAEKAYETWLKDSPSGTYKRGGYNYKNETLIEKLNLIDEEMIKLETIISKKEIKRRNNERTKESQKVKRRNKEGLTKRQQDKLNKENKIKELIKKGYNKSEIARELNLNRSTITRSYNYLFN
ncbi:DNA-binding response regulator [Clostridium botulinum]|uniref:DNA-binding response regulator n=1 Tax=Clostridium botulinum TaxID=1491 RepID=A0AA43YB07_CLOBO|nr:DNA-binding response regulator [Clostridium botulinum]NFI23487.1 DNA-binding response regulator [Clostridium botulinum]NFQ80329.1 DNA-binding response regulator [Clostridium botulinum]